MAETLRAEPVLSSPPLEIFASLPEDADPMSHPLSGKVAIVTGGSRGIGAAITRRLARDGADVAFSYASNTARAEEIAAAISANGVRALLWHWLRERPVSECGRLCQREEGHGGGSRRRSVLMFPTLSWSRILGIAPSPLMRKEYRTRSPQRAREARDF